MKLCRWVCCEYGTWWTWRCQSTTTMKSGLTMLCAVGGTLSSIHHPFHCKVCDVNKNGFCLCMCCETHAQKWLEMNHSNSVNYVVEHFEAYNAMLIMCSQRHFYDMSDNKGFVCAPSVREIWVEVQRLLLLSLFHALIMVCGATSRFPNQVL